MEIVREFTAELQKRLKEELNFIQSECREAFNWELKDLLSFASIHKPALFRQTFTLSLAYPAMEVSLQKLLGQLQESGISTRYPESIPLIIDLTKGTRLLEGAPLLEII